MLGTVVKGGIPTGDTLSLLLEEGGLDLRGGTTYHPLGTVQKDPSIKRTIKIFAVITLTILPTEYICLKTLTILLQTP